MDVSNLGLTLSLLRIADGISLEDLADAAGVSKGEPSRYLKGTATPTFDTLATLLHLLDVEYPAFFTHCAWWTSQPVPNPGS